MIHFFKSDLGFIYGGKSKTRHEHKIQKSSSLGSISTFWVKPEPQPHLKTSLVISMLQVCIKRNKVPKELHYHFIIQISLEPNLTYKIRTPTSYISNYY